MDQIKINVTKAPGFVLRLGLRESVLFAVVVVPQLGDDKDVLTLDKAFVDGTLDALSCFFLVLVVVSAVKETIAYFDGLGAVSLLVHLVWFGSLDVRCRLYRRLGQLVPSKGRSQREACHGQKQV